MVEPRRNDSKIGYGQEFGAAFQNVTTLGMTKKVKAIGTPRVQSMANPIELMTSSYIYRLISD